MYSAKVSGVGSYLPNGKLTNQDLEELVVTSDEWILTRTGISERTIAGKEQSTSDLAYYAAQAALSDSGYEPEQIELLIVATETPDYQFPPTACLLQHRLGCVNAAAFDVHLVCTGFIAAMHTAEIFVKAGRYKHILVVGADINSRITDYTDRTTCILFSDGAGAVVVSRGEAEQIGIIHSAIHSDGQYFNAAYIPGGGSRHPLPSHEEHKSKIVMDGHKVFKLAVDSMSRTVIETLAASGKQLDDINWVIPHQANQRIIDAVARNLAIPTEKMISTIRYIGNNSAATIPIALDIAMKDGRIRKGDTVMLTAFGGGLAWGSLLMKL